MLERDVENAVCSYAKKLGFLTYKFTSPNRRSVPDRLFLGPGGIHFFIEFKAPGKQPTPGQWRELKRIAEHGHSCYIVDNIEQGKIIVTREFTAVFGPPPVPKQGVRTHATPQSKHAVAGHGAGQDDSKPELDS